MRESLLTQFQNENKYMKWNSTHGKDPWVVQPSTWEKKHEWSNKWQVAVEHERPSGVIIYTPHDCDRPDATTLPVGTIWECHGQTRKNPDGLSKMCYDQWIIEVNANSEPVWTLFKRSF
jgi:hypothetical protein